MQFKINIAPVSGIADYNIEYNIDTIPDPYTIEYINISKLPAYKMDEFLMSIARRPTGNAHISDNGSDALSTTTYGGLLLQKFEVSKRQDLLGDLDIAKFGIRTPYTNNILNQDVYNRYTILPFHSLYIDSYMESTKRKCNFTLDDNQIRIIKPEYKTYIHEDILSSKEMYKTTLNYLWDIYFKRDELKSEIFINLIDSQYKTWKHADLWTGLIDSNDLTIHEGFMLQKLLEYKMPRRFGWSFDHLLFKVQGSGLEKTIFIHEMDFMYRIATKQAHLDESFVFDYSRFNNLKCVLSSEPWFSNVEVLINIYLHSLVDMSGVALKTGINNLKCIFVPDEELQYTIKRISRIPWVLNDKLLNARRLGERESHIDSSVLLFYNKTRKNRPGHFNIELDNNHRIDTKFGYIDETISHTRIPKQVDIFPSFLEALDTPKFSDNLYNMIDSRIGGQQARIDDDYNRIRVKLNDKPGRIWYDDTTLVKLSNKDCENYILNYTLETSIAGAGAILDKQADPGKYQGMKTYIYEDFICKTKKILKCDSIAEVVATLKTCEKPEIWVSDIVCKIPTKKGYLEEDIICSRSAEKLGYIMEDLLSSYEIEWQKLLDMYPPDPDAIDIMDVPNTDYDYPNRPLELYDPITGQPSNPVDPNNMADAKIRVYAPNVHYMNNRYHEIGHKQLPVEVLLLKDMIIALWKMKKHYTSNLAGIDPRTAVEFLLDRFAEYLEEHKILYQDVDPDKLDRIFKLMRLYGESVVMKHSEYWLIRDYTDYLVPIYKDGFTDFQFMTENNGFINKDGTLISVDNPANIRFEWEAFIDGEVYITVFTQMSGATVDINGTIHEIPDNRVTVLDESISAGANYINIMTQGATFKVGTIRLGGAKFLGATTEYCNDTVTGLKACNDLMQMLTHYFGIHHDSMTKSKRFKIL